MQCSSCGMTLPTGSAFCTNCGARVSSQGTPGTPFPESSQVDPTVVASPSYDPAQIVPPSSPPGTPPTAYGAPSYNTPPPNPYGVSPSPNLYGSPPPPPPYPYVAPPPLSNPYGAPYAPPPGSFIPPNQPPTRRQGPRIGLIIGIVVLLLLLIGGGILALHAATGGSQANNNTATPTTVPSATTAPSSSPTTSTSPAVTPTTQGVAPSGSPVDPTSAAIITNAQTASAVDSNSFPTNLTRDFAVGQTVYVTFHLTLHGQSGYAEAKLYSGTTYIGNKILTVQSTFDHGYFTATLNQASTGTIELYWCTQANCSDAKLATFVVFNVA